MSVEKSIICDGCGTILGSAKTAKEARRDARESWDAIQIGCRDYCFNCAETAKLSRGQR